jgi:RimJ/RimL family protein N-acetyltransferase
MKLILRTPRAILRPLTPADTDLIWPYVSDSEVSKYMSWNAHKNKSETRNFLKRIQAERKKGQNISWGILIGDQFAGIISIISIMRTHRALTYDKAELAYWLAPNFRKKGIMTEAGLRVIDYAFKHLGIHRLTVSHVSQNTESEKLIKRWNFRYIGEESEAFKKNGTWYNHRLYELLNRNHEPLRSTPNKL